MGRAKSALHRQLDRLVARQDTTARLLDDPVQFARRYDDPADQEIVALLSSSLAFGNVTAVRASIEKILDKLGSNPSKKIRLPEARLRRLFGDFVHRIYRGPHVAKLLHNAGRLQKKHGGLGKAFEEVYDRNDSGLRESMAEFADELRGEKADRSMRHLVSDPRAGSACKRYHLWLRWMARPDDGVDFGLWQLPTSALLMPVDTHVLRIGQNLGLTERSDASWRTAEEITSSLRAFDANDPVKYDFALCHLGVSRQCPSRRVDELCQSCVLKPVCLAYAGTIE